MLKSILCRREHFDSDWFARWSERIGYPAPAAQHLHRKVWEWTAITEALTERGCVAPGKRGLGFAVGAEPIVSLFAALGAEIEATDLIASDTVDIWRSAHQHSDSKDSLFRGDIIDRTAFDERVSFHNADMTDLAAFERNSYDFIWSSCAMEHLGSLTAGLNFVSAAMDLLKPGGVACHTTEFNISSIDETLTEGMNVIYREADLRGLDRALRLKLCCVEPFDLAPGTDAEDILYDFPPFGQHGRTHVTLLLDGYIATSTLLICRKFG